MTITEPDYLAQCGETMSHEQGREWIAARIAEARARGVTWGRFTIHPEIGALILYEGWKVRPDDEGEARFQLAKTE